MAAYSSKFCTDEEMEKALADLDDLYARTLDECKFHCTQAEESIKKLEEWRAKEAMKKKKLYLMPPDHVQKILDYKFRPLDEHKGLKMLEELEGKEKYRDLRTLFDIYDTFTKRHYDIMRTYSMRPKVMLHMKPQPRTTRRKKRLRYIKGFEVAVDGGGTALGSPRAAEGELSKD